MDTQYKENVDTY